MRNRFIKRFICVVAAISLVITALAGVAAASGGDDAPAANNVSPIALTRGEAAERVYQTASKYNQDLKKEGILIGYGDGNLYEEKPISYYEMLVILDKCFGPLPKAAGSNALVMSGFADISDAPAWAAPAASGMMEAGVLHDRDDGLDDILARIYRVLGRRPQDDFYEYINKEWLDTATFPEGIPQNGSIVEMTLAVQKQLEKLLDELAANTHKAGTKEKKVSALYSNLLDMKARNADGIKPIEKYLDRMRAAASLDELLELDTELNNTLGTYYLIAIVKAASLEDSSIKAPFFATIEPKLPKEDYMDDSSARIAPYIWIMTQIQTLCGVPEDTAAANAKAVFEMEKSIASVMKQSYELSDFSISYKSHELSEIAEIFPNIDIGAVVKDRGIILGGDEKIIVKDLGAATQAGKWFDDAFLDTLKAYMEINFILDNANFLSEDFLVSIDRYSSAMSGVETSQTIKQRAVNTTLALMGDYVSQIYIEAVASNKVKRDVEKMVDEFISVYKARIKDNEWMSGSTKATALKKLDTVTMKIGWPDKWEDSLKDRDLLLYSEGGSLFENCGTIRLAGWDLIIAEQNDPVDRDKWLTAPYTVNAFYNPQNNEIIVPYAFLQPPVYDINVSRSANLGALGMVIAHELTHAFDNTGAQFNEFGNVANWWTDDDMAAFMQLCMNVAYFFDGIEVAPGIRSNGLLTLGENVADLGAISCSLEVAMKDPDFDADEYFTAYATWLRGLFPFMIIEYINLADPHSYCRIRVNNLLQNFDVFYETYDIKPGDGLYIPETERVRVW